MTHIDLQSISSIFRVYAYVPTIIPSQSAGFPFSYPLSCAIGSSNIFGLVPGLRFRRRDTVKGPNSSS